uniref:Immunoglobulin V-set domain-containing protein n=1 Tax=Loxodonta africana TaxID=9785 RepID=G3UDM8_LOXAF
IWELFPLQEAVALPSGCSAISGPKAVSGPKRGSLTVRCSYGPGRETYYKWWCRGAVWNSCKILVKTTGSEKEVKEVRMSIRDSQKNHTFIVTMEKLREDYAGFHWCGIERTGIDLGAQLKVSFGPVLLHGKHSWESQLRGPSALAGVYLLDSVLLTIGQAAWALGTLGVPRSTQPQPHLPCHRSPLINVRFCILVFLEVPLFLVMLSAVLWVNRPQR